ncbi:tRNA preQ1(34) S-adenosylmethionine ribosyltransferase-isomerase QueA [Anoxybacter fermentans]|uniref:S-adenosylmethionine:tRNA ribosyltransferase-isomerase n=1 Tax=Anoxybacter fermentans TaxID=1323375 RepID=A0A3Q9HQ93_9FIRM|nr:tRNA preQ1(34) S-adenosylmethionine ribosyltransferase-isomerase QueA [Anoxybacter fermentans]AZR73109.1 tRNA preQ1(34) S-adenosylmethionine ribosyltransferase-isomerase QueA [Anoxybacter fermentans]
MKVVEFDFDLPEELIAQTPIEPRDHSRLLVVFKNRDGWKEGIFKDIVNYLNPGDLLVFNDTKVIPARLYGNKKTGAVIEVLLLTSLSDDKWEVLVRPGKKMRIGDEVIFGNGLLKGKVIDYTDFGGRVMEFSYKGDFDQIIDQLGEMPLPPYITAELKNPDRYQTVYAARRGSAAAPTAGLHFTEQLIEDLRDKGIQTAYVTLHVGLGTFRPVKVDEVEDHVMHSEFYEVSSKTADLINSIRAKGGRVIAVGTTTTRTLETVADENGIIHPGSGWTDIFIYPGYKFKAIDGLITNFHLPKSTLIMMVSALIGREKVMQAYQYAIKKRYRFFSFGDAMLII